MAAGSVRGRAAITQILNPPTAAPTPRGGGGVRAGPCRDRTTAAGGREWECPEDPD